MKKTLIGLIFCSGKGTRLYPITQSIPKPLIKISNDITFLDVNINYLLNLGIKIIYINYSFGYQYFTDVVKKYPNVEFKFVKEEKPLGHGNTILKVANQAKSSLSDFQILAINGDTIFKSCGVDFTNIIFDQNECIRVYGSQIVSHLPKNLFVSNNEVLGVKGSTKDYFYKKTDDNLINGNTLGLYLISDKICNITDVNFSEFLGLFGEDDLVERAINSGLIVKYEDTEIVNYYSVNTEIELNKLRESSNDL